MEKGEPRLPRVQLLQWVLWQWSRINRVYTDIKNANNTKINHIMVSFTDHYNAISIDRLPSKSKIGKDSLFFNNCLLCKAKFSSATKTFPFLLKTQKTTTFQKMTDGNTPILALKIMVRYFLKIPALKKILQIPDRSRFFY